MLLTFFKLMMTISYKKGRIRQINSDPDGSATLFAAWALDGPLPGVDESAGQARVRHNGRLGLIEGPKPQ